MSKSVFQFKNFSLQHGNCSHKIGTDSMVLGCWAHTEKKPERILDIGAGSGVLGFMMAQKYPFAHVIAIESDPESIKDLKANIDKHHFNLTAIHQRLQDFQPDSSFDLIITNPPFYQTNYINADQRKASARHAGSTLFFEDIIQFAEKYLENEGVCWMILPESAYFSLEESQLSVAHHFSIVNDQNEPIRKVMGLTKVSKKISYQELMIRKNGKYSQAYKTLTRDYHGKKL